MFGRILLSAIDCKILHKSFQMNTSTNTVIHFHRTKNSEETMPPNHVTGVVPAARAETKNAVVLGLVIEKGTVETRTVNEAKVKKNSEGVKVETVKEVEAEIGPDRIDIVAARVKRVVGEGGRGHAQGIVSLGRGRRLASVEASEAG